MKLDKHKVIGIAAGALCALCVFAYTQNVQHEIDEAHAAELAAYGGEQVEVYVAARDIAAGEVVDASAVETQLWVASLLPSGAVTASDSIIGQQTTSPIYKGEVVVTKRFGSLSSSIEVPAGMVALSVSAKEVQAVGGSLKPGAYVDVYASGSSSTTLIAQDVLVLATSATDSSGTSSGSSLTWIALAVQPASVSEIIAAEQKTQLYFALPGEDTVTSRQGAANGQ